MTPADAAAMADTLQRMILAYTQPVTFGLHPALAGADEPWYRAASATYVDLNGPKLVTCRHVICAYEEKVLDDSRVSFDAFTTITPLEGMNLQRSKRADLAVIDLAQYQFPVQPKGMEALHLYRAPSWPPDRPNVGDEFNIGGWPEVLSNSSNGGSAVGHTPLTINGLKVTHAFEDTFHAQIPWEALAGVERDALHAYLSKGGLSGAPAFGFRPGQPIDRYELIGFIIEWQELGDRLILTYSDHIRQDGKLW